ncbi:MAG: beta-galactosidase [Acidobacteriia bacterium]|nr:beta-galactosidase [Terriglobia bacterium]
MSASAFIGVPAFAQKASPAPPPVQPAGVEIVSNGGEPELRVGGVPFFVHAAQFDYFRVPPDLWARSLLRYRDLGINTIDIHIPWNWHEPQDGQFDFDGHTNPGRDLRSLLSLIARMNFKLIARPGPLAGEYWPNAGIPSWLLARAEYGMSGADIQDGIAPPDAQLAARDSNAAARRWLANEIHMTCARRWLTAVAAILAPYNAKNMISAGDPGDPASAAKDAQIPGPLLFVALDDAVAVPPSAVSADLAQYLAELRGALARGGLDAIFFSNLPGASTQALAPLPDGTAPEKSVAIGLAGEWIFNPQPTPPMAKINSRNSDAQVQRSLVSTADASLFSLLGRTLASQPGFPPILSAFSSTTFAPAGDTQAAQPAAENTLLASRLFWGSGIRGMVYSPLQDTLTPAGWEIPSAARYFRWDAPLDLAGNRGPRAAGVSRNGQFISAWSAMLAASHVQADFGIVDLRMFLSNADPSASARAAQEMEKLCRVASLAGYAPEIVSPGAQSADRLQRDPLILLRVPAEDGGNFQLPERAQEALLEFVRRGGVLVYFPARPQGSRLEPLWRAAPPTSPAHEDNEWSYERGRVIASPADFFSWVQLGQDLGKNREQPESPAALNAFRGLMERAGVRRNLIVTDDGNNGENVVASVLAANGTVPGAPRTAACAEKQLCAAALISVTNLNPEQPAQETLELNLPGAAGAARKISFDVTVPARDSLLLPVHAPLCATSSPTENCSDEVIVAGAEMSGALRDGKTLELSFYTPARAIVRLHLESAPSKVEFDEDYRAESEWKQETGELEVQLPRGSSPDYMRMLRIHLRYTPHVPEKADPEKDEFRGLDYEFSNAIRYPLAPDVTIPTSPPLLAADPNSGGRIIITTRNQSDDLRTSDFTLDGAFHGTGFARVYSKEQQTTRLRYQPTRAPAPGNTPPAQPDESLLGAQLTIHSGRERSTSPVSFLIANDAGYSHYQHDFDRDGTPESVLESSRLRLIVSPAYGGRALALVDKDTNDNLIALGGALHDLLIPAGAPPQDAPLSADFSFNRGYRAEWTEEKPGAGLRLTYEERENSHAGLRVEKTMHFTSPETFEASYHISYEAAPSAEPRTSGAGTSFLSEMSIPVMAGDDRAAQFCWQPESSAVYPAPTSPVNAASGIHCEDFIPRGEPIPIPEGTTRMVIRSYGRRALAVEWTSGRAWIIPKAYSAQIRFTVPFSQSGDAPGDFTLRYTIQDAP